MEPANPYESSSKPASSAGSYGGHPRTNGLAIAGFVLGLLSVTLGCVSCPPLFSIPGLIFSMIGRNQIRETGEDGRGLAVTGMILSGISLAFLVFAIALYVGLLAAGMLSEKYKP
ncbi:MAG: DUF4190 domain-containing protein [Leptospiraceae bacterium]|nr:DUF4190 domain-containing protein [Leptospiraceae bacterium]